jgi:hypothetical protein
LWLRLVRSGRTRTASGADKPLGVTRGVPDGIDRGAAIVAGNNPLWQETHLSSHLAFCDNGATIAGAEQRSGTCNDISRLTHNRQGAHV